MKHMQHLNKYILEANTIGEYKHTDPDVMLSYIKDITSNPENLKKLSISTLRTCYGALISDLLKPDENDMKSFFDSIGIKPHIAEEVRLKFIKNGEIQWLYEYMLYKINSQDPKQSNMYQAPGMLPDSTELINNASSGNNYNIFDLFGETGVSQNTLMDLFKYNPKDGITVGFGEILCRLLLSDLNPENKSNGNQGKGDICTESNILELKCGSARVIGAFDVNISYAQENLVKNIMMELGVDSGLEKEFLKKSNQSSGLFSSYKSKHPISDFYNDFIIENYELTIDVFVNILTTYFVDAYKLKDNKIISNIKQFINKHIIDFSNIRGNVIKRIKNEEYLIRIIGCIQLCLYKYLDKWDYIVVMSHKGDYTVVGNNTNNPTEILEQTWNNKHIVFPDGPRNTSADKGSLASQQACHISYID